jgi:16S rRNA (guanine966-N2)-methyltransferase
MKIKLDITRRKTASSWRQVNRLGYVAKMRIIAGTARGRKLMEPPDRRIRPTLDKVRGALFNMLMPEIEDAVFLDLFAGTGANGIEALSRGAASCVFVDNDGEAQKIIRENLFHTGLARQARCLPLALPADMGRITGTYDIIFADPPYHNDYYAALLEGIVQHKLLHPDGVIVLEHDRREDLPENIAGLERTRFKHYGDAALSAYRFAGEAD